MSNAKMNLADLPKYFAAWNGFPFDLNLCGHIINFLTKTQFWQICLEVNLMKKYIGIILTLFASIGLAACGSAVETNSNANAANANSNSFVNMNANELPEGFSNKPVNIDTNSVEGINSNSKMEKVPDDVSPAPGIPSANDLKKQMKKGATPTPGIPSQDELKKQMSKPAANVSTDGDQMMRKSDDQMMMKKKPANANSDQMMMQKRPNKP